MAGLGLSAPDFSPTPSERDAAERALGGAQMQAQESVLADLDRLQEEGRVVFI